MAAAWYRQLKARDPAALATLAARIKAAAVAEEAAAAAAAGKPRADGW
jgi:hypothetical protein